MKHNFARILITNVLALAVPAYGSYTIGGLYVHSSSNIVITNAQGHQHIGKPSMHVVPVEVVVPVHDIRNYLTKAIAHAQDFQPTPTVTIKIANKLFLLWIDQRGLMIHRKFIPGTMLRDQAITRIECPADKLPASKKVYLVITDSDVRMWRQDSKSPQATR